MKVLVIGDSCTDEYIYGNCDRLCPDAPVPVLNPTRIKTSLGMAGNVLENLSSLGICAHIITQKEEIKKTRYVHERTNQMFVRVDSEPQRIQPLKNERLKLVKWEDYDAVIVSDYDKGFLSKDIIQNISKKHPLTFIDTKKVIGAWINDYKWIKINEIENNKSFHPFSVDFNGNRFDNFEQIKDKLIITLGQKGAQYKDKIYGVDQVEVKDMTGAGDTFLAAFVFEYLTQLKVLEEQHLLFDNEDFIKNCIMFANKASTQVVQKKGTSVIDLTKLYEYEHRI